MATGGIEPQVLAFDSSVLILFLNDALADDAVELFNTSLHAGKAEISAIVRAEVLAWSGHSVASLEAASALLNICKLTPVTLEVADEAARIRRETGLKLPDSLIAATALLQSASLVTANGKDFRRVSGLTLIEA